MYYVLDENNNKVEAYSREEVLAVINKAIADGSLANLVADAAFITRVKCCVGGSTHLFAFVTQEKYNELKVNNQLVENCYYFITDDTTAEEINKQLEEINTSLEETKTKLNNIYKRIYNASSDTGDNTCSVDSYTGSQKGYFKVVVKIDNYYYCVELPAVNNSCVIVNAFNSTASTVIYIDAGIMRHLDSTGNTLLNGIMAIDYYTVG